MAEEKTRNDELKNLLKKYQFEKKSGWAGLVQSDYTNLTELAEGYKMFLDASKTEREAIRTIEKMATDNGFKNIEDVTPQDKKLFLSFDGVAGALVYINDPNDFKSGFLMNGAHIDVPRLDLKPFPLYQSEDMAYLKTHYYGGIKKYQWVTRPLALHGTVILESGKAIHLSIGEQENDPVFTINDLLPHLAQTQYDKPAPKLIEGEQLNILVGSIPYQFDNSAEGHAGKSAIKLAILDELYRQYGMIEEDFISAELQVVPAGKSRDVGLDRSFVGAHGQDDRICAYLGMKALFDVDKTQTSKNLMMVFFDKEEIGSMGNCGANSNLVERMVNQVLKVYEKNDYSLLIDALANSCFLSSDVNAGVDPEWKDVNEPMNAAKIGYGVCLTKYTGSRGKSGSNEAHAEFVAKIRAAFNKDDVRWQNAELGKVDQGGGGTVAYFLAQYGMDVVDCGPALLSMHSPFEVSSKIDIFHTYKAYMAYYKYL